MLRPTDGCGVFAWIGWWCAAWLFLLVAAEAFELVELALPGATATDGAQVSGRIGAGAPRLSIQLPICAEPPDLVERTLRALAALPQPLEVIVVDNNTAEVTLWQPVERLCNPDLDSDPAAGDTGHRAYPGTPRRVVSAVLSP